jgi:hypothetical protein
MRVEAGRIRDFDGISEQEFARVEGIYQRIIYQAQHNLQLWMVVHISYLTPRMFCLEDYTIEQLDSSILV